MLFYVATGNFFPISLGCFYNLHELYNELRRGEERRVVVINTIPHDCGPSVASGVLV